MHQNVSVHLYCSFASSIALFLAVVSCSQHCMPLRTQGSSLLLFFCLPSHQMALTNWTASKHYVLQNQVHDTMSVLCMQASRDFQQALADRFKLLMKKSTAPNQAFQRLIAGLSPPTLAAGLSPPPLADHFPDSDTLQEGPTCQPHPQSYPADTSVPMASPPSSAAGLPAALLPYPRMGAAAATASMPPPLPQLVSQAMSPSPAEGSANHSASHPLLVTPQLPPPAFSTASPATSHQQCTPFRAQVHMLWLGVSEPYSKQTVLPANGLTVGPNMSLGALPGCPTPQQALSPSVRDVTTAVEGEPAVAHSSVILPGSASAVPQLQSQLPGPLMKAWMSDPFPGIHDLCLNPQASSTHFLQLLT